MSTVTIDLYALWQRGRFITDLSNAAVPTLPAVIAGDLWDITSIFVDDTTPFVIHRFSGSAVRGRIRAAGNNQLYADAAAFAEIVNTAPTVGRTSTGGTSTIETQTLAFHPPPIGGTFRLGFSGAGSGARGGGISLGNPSPYEVYTAPIAYNATAADILAAILDIRGYYHGNDGPYTFAELAAQYGAQTRSPAVSGSIAGTIGVSFGDLYGGANYWNTGIHIFTVDDSALEYKNGWHILLSFGASNFNDVFLPANGPAFLEITLDGNIAAAYQIAGTPGSGNAPAFTNSPPGSGAVGTPYNFNYLASGSPVPTFALTSGNFPPGLSLSSTGQLTGTPVTSGTYTGVVTATNSNGSATQAFSITIGTGTADLPIFTNFPPPGGTVGASYSFAFTASGFPAPTFTLASGALPPGLSLSSSGLLFGTPAAIGTFSGYISATNSAGFQNYNFSITIAASSGGGGPGGAPPPSPGLLLAYRNGSFTGLDQSDGAYFEDRDDEWPGLRVWHIPYVIDFDQYLASIPAIGSFEGPYGYFWKDTPIRFLADGVVEFERLRHNIPGDANRAISASKNIQEANYTTQAGHILDFVINSYSRDVNANCNYHYALDDPGGVPVVPALQIVPFLISSKQITDFGSGFPTGTRNGIPNLYTDNKGNSYLPGSSRVHVLGRLFCRMILTG